MKYVLAITLALTSASAAASAVFADGAQPDEKFKKVFIVILENQSFRETMAAPFISKLINDGALLTNYIGLARPSQPNYIALTSGNTWKINTNSNVDLSVKSVADLLEDQAKSWKTYAENYPGNCYLKASSGSYARKHVPFLSYKNISSDAKRCVKIVDASQFDKDLEANDLPNFSLFIPNNKNNGHDTGIQYADKYLKKRFGPLLKNPQFMKDMLFVLTFDEGGLFNQHIATILVGDAITAGVKNNKLYSHYDLLRTIEDNFELGTLGQFDKKAHAIDGIWKVKLAPNSVEN